MQLDPDQYIDFDINHIDLGYQVWALESYITLLEEQIAFSKGQYKLRTERKVQKELTQHDENEYEESISAIDQMVDNHFPRFFRNGAIITVWSFFEYISTDFAIYAQRNENPEAASFKATLDKKDKDKGYDQVLVEYFEDKLGIELPWVKEERESLSKLRLLRNHIVHQNGNVIYETNEDRERRQRISSVKDDKSTIYALDSDVVNYSILVVGVIKSVYRLLANKYNHAIFL